MRTRIAIAIPGLLLGAYGIFRLLSEISNSDLIELLFWLIAAVVLHDGVLAPIVVGFGWAFSHVVPPRGRRYLQGGLIAAALVTVVAVPLIYREGKGAASKAILRQDYSTNLVIALVIVAGVTLLAYLAGIVQGRQRVRTTNVRPADVHDSTES